MDCAQSLCPMTPRRLQRASGSPYASSTEQAEHVRTAKGIMRTVLYTRMTYSTQTSMVQRWGTGFSLQPPWGISGTRLRRVILSHSGRELSAGTWLRGTLYAVVERYAMVHLLGHILRCESSARER
jgi:hypothetical protein